MKSSYLLKYHDFYFQRIAKLKEQVKELHNKLSNEEFRQHEIVKLAYRIREADQEIIPQDPNRPEYRLTGDLRKYRRYKQGLQRYRLFFCFSNQPKIILYLYLNDEKHLRKAGDKGDPYDSGFADNTDKENEQIEQYQRNKVETEKERDGRY